ncbi:MAG: hypothetical protein ABSC48_07495 [Terracidiphilus sp.]|jgi:hypothetical protein
MIGDAKNEAEGAPGAAPDPGKPADDPARLGRVRSLLLLPGLAAISLYMMVLAGINILGVAMGQAPPAFLVFSALFIAAGLGLLLLLRWAWALTLAAVVLLVALFLWKFAASHDFPYAIQGLLNLVFFLYLVRTEVREKLR